MTAFTALTHNRHALTQWQGGNPYDTSRSLDPVFIPCNPSHPAIWWKKIFSPLPGRLDASESDISLITGSRGSDGTTYVSLYLPGLILNVLLATLAHHLVTNTLLSVHISRLPPAMTLLLLLGLVIGQPTSPVLSSSTSLGAHGKSRITIPQT